MGTEARPTYAETGVDIAAGERAKERYKSLVAMTRRPEVLADVGPFSGLFRLSGYRDPVLVASVDGVGTKVKIARLLGRLESVGHDLVNHCVNDALTTGAHPLFFLDYVAGDGLTEEMKVAIVSGVAAACREVGAALLGGETADLPGIYLPGEFDLAGFIIGVVERDAVIDGSSIAEGDVALVLPSNGLHTNGYSLARRVFGLAEDTDREAELARAAEIPPGLGVSIGDALLTPHRCYLRDLTPVLPYIKGIAHVTGGGLPGNVHRVLPESLAARLDASTWTVPAIFRLIQERGGVATDEMYRVFNMGAGMVLVCDEPGAIAVERALPEARRAGRVEHRAGQQQVFIDGV